MSHEQPNGPLFVKTTIKVMGGKWKLLILWHLKDEAKRFSELKRLIPEITEKVLSQQLKELEQDGVVRRTDYLEVPLRVDYAFTEYGKSLIPVIKPLCDWGQEHLKRING